MRHVSSTDSSTQASSLLYLLWRPAVIVGLACLGLLTFIVFSRGYTVLDFVHLGTVWSEHKADGTWGYDGQFYYQLARDPWNAHIFIDDAPYRYQRIFYPLLVAVLSLGQPFLIPYMLLLVNFVDVVASVELCAQLLVKRKLSPWFALPVGLYFGQAAALSFDTAEPLSLLLIILAVWMWERGGRWSAALCFGLAALTRETVLIFACGYVLYVLLQRRWRDLLPLLICGVLPIILWLIALIFIFGRTGLTFSPAMERIPFGGVWAIAQTPRKFWMVVALVLVPTILNCVYLVWELLRRRTWRDPQTLGWLAIWFVHLWMIVFLSHYSFLDLISVARISSSLILAGVLYGVLMRQRVLLWGMQYHCLSFLVFFGGVALGVDSFIL